MASILTKQLAELPASWQCALADLVQNEQGQQLAAFLEGEYASQRVYPSQEQLLYALKLTPLESVKVVILGQDPYHGPGQAHGLSFSVDSRMSLPPSLVNIFKELHADLNIAPPMYGELSGWARQGVLLLNSVLSVREGEPNSHANMGWEPITDAILRAVDLHCDHVVFMLWGRFAGNKITLLNEKKHTILQAAHPSPLSFHRGFKGCRHFSQANAALLQHGQAGIDWHDVEF